MLLLKLTTDPAFTVNLRKAIGVVVPPIVWAVPLKTKREEVLVPVYVPLLVKLPAKFRETPP